MSVTLITPTRNRPVPFSLLERWIRRQTYDGPLQWIVANDGKLPYTYRADQDVVHRKTSPKEGHSLPLNILAALPHVRHEYIFIVEDDDWYAPDYIENHLSVLQQGYMLTGCKPSRHYNLLTKRFRTFQLDHCNLGSTAFHRDMLNNMEQVCQDRAEVGSFSVDTRLWKAPVAKKWRENIANHVQHVGLKGMPGEPGLGMGHKLDYGVQDDANIPVLRQWIGEEDWNVYRQVSEGVYSFA